MKESFWSLLGLFLFFFVVYLFFGGWAVIYMLFFPYSLGLALVFVYGLIAYGLSYLISKPVKKRRILVRLVTWTILLAIFSGLIFRSIAIYAVAWFTGFLFMTRDIIRKKLSL